MRRITLTLLSTGLIAGSLAQANAQQVDGARSMFARDRNISVTERSRPEFESDPIQNGAFLFNPELNLGLESLDNVFGTASNEQSDLVAIIEPRLRFETTWSRHSFNGDVSVTRREYSDFSDESVSNWTAGTAAQLDVDRFSFLSLGARYSDLTEPRTSSGAAGRAAEPIEYNSFNTTLGAERAAGRFRLQGDVSWDSLDYTDAPLFGGGIADQDFRDRLETRYTVRSDYALSPDTAVFVRASSNTRDYDLASTPVRDSEGYTIELGSDFDVGNLARGILALGYTRQDYESVNFDKIDGLGADIQLEWFPSQLTTLTFTASRSVSDSAITNSAGYFGNSASFAIDHELRRNIIVSGGVNFGEDEYSNIDRTDKRVGINAGLTYYMNRNVGVRASWSYTDQDSSGVDGNQSYSKNVIGINLVLRP